MVVDDHGCSVGGCLDLIFESSVAGGVCCFAEGFLNHVLWIASLAEVVGHGFTLACEIIIIGAQATDS